MCIRDRMKNNRSISFGEAIREGLLQASEIDPSVIHFAEGVEALSGVWNLEGYRKSNWPKPYD